MRGEGEMQSQINKAVRGSFAAGDFVAACERFGRLQTLSPLHHPRPLPQHADAGVRVDFCSLSGCFLVLLSVFRD
jgi:hypothetical protein